MTEPRVVVFAPVLPRWDGGRFFTPVLRQFADLGCQVDVVDTLSRLDDSVEDITDLATRWAAEAESADLVAGNALGGAVVQALLPTLRTVPVLLVSAPARTEQILERRLSSVAEPAAAGNLTESLRRLAELIEPEGAAAPRTPSVPEDVVACRRIAGGMRLLSGIDLTAQVSAYPGPLLHFVGERSRLVTRSHTDGAGHHEIVVVPGAGMRPHRDRPEFVADHLTRFVKENLSR